MANTKVSAVLDKIVEKIQEVTSVVTATRVVSANRLDLFEVTMAQTPIVFVIEPDESNRYQPSNRERDEVTCPVRVLMVDWTDNPKVIDAIIKDISDKLGGNSRMGETCTDVSIGTITKIEYEYPLLCKQFNLKILLHFSATGV